MWKIYFLPVSLVQCRSKIRRRTESSFVATSLDFKWFPFMLLFFNPPPPFLSPSVWQLPQCYCSSVCCTSNTASFSFTQHAFNTVRPGGRVWSGADALTGCEHRGTLKEKLLRVLTLHFRWTQKVLAFTDVVLPHLRASWRKLWNGIDSWPWHLKACRMLRTFGKRGVIILSLPVNLMNKCNKCLTKDFAAGLYDAARLRHCSVWLL